MPLFLYGRPIDTYDEYDTERKSFNRDIVLVYRIDHEFCNYTEEDMNYINTIQERLFKLPLGKDVGKYLSLSLARGLEGDRMRRIMFGLGMTNTGKGILTKACQLSMGQYCDDFTGENLAFSNVNNTKRKR